MPKITSLQLYSTIQDQLLNLLTNHFSLLFTNDQNNKEQLKQAWNNAQSQAIAQLSSLVQILTFNEINKEEVIKLVDLFRPKLIL